MLAKLGVKTTCKTCGKEIYVTKSEFEKSESKNFFCCHSCSATYTNAHREITEEHNQSALASTRRKREPNDSKIKEAKVCKICGETHCQNPKICKSNFFYKPVNILKLGFDMNTVGSPDVYKEVSRIKQILEQEYIIKRKSIPMLMKQYGIASERTFEKLFNFFDIKSRSRSEALSIAYYRGDVKLPEVIRYKHGWHTTWENHKAYYRSSYEKRYMDFLDKERIPYDVEILRIRYYNSTLHQWRTAIPDFYLPDTKTIVEVKNKYEYQKCRLVLIDKMKEYKRLGFNFILLLDHVEYDTCI